MEDINSAMEALQTGEQYYKEGKLELAEFLLIEAKEFFEKNDDKENLARASIGLSDVFTAGGRHDLAIEEANIASKLTSMIDVAARAHLRRGICYRRQGEFVKALYELDQAARLFEDVADSIKVAESNIAMGDVYWKQRNWGQAKQHYEATLGIISSIMKSQHLDTSEGQFHQAQAKYAIGRLAILKREYDEAQKNLDESYRILLKIENFFGLSMCEQLKGNLFEKRGKFDQARFWYSESLITNLIEGNPLRKVESTYYIANLKNIYGRKNNSRVKAIASVAYEEAAKYKFHEIAFWLKQLLANIYFDENDFMKTYQEYTFALGHALRTDTYVVLDFLHKYDEKVKAIHTKNQSGFGNKLTNSLISYFNELRVDGYSGREFEQKQMIKAGVITKDGVVLPYLNNLFEPES